MSCKFCIERGKTWEGSNPICAFKNEVFDSNNWNCATMNILRGKSEDFFSYRDDSCNASIGIIPIPEECLDENDHIQSGYIVMTWYKNRGKTGQAYVMVDDFVPQPLKRHTAIAVCSYYNNNPRYSGGKEERDNEGRSDER